MSNNNFSNKPDQVAGNGYFDQVSVGGGYPYMETLPQVKGLLIVLDR